MTSKQAVQEVLEGELRNIVFANESGEFTVARLLRSDGSIQTVVGNLSGVRPGEFLKLHGAWVNNQKYGKQFQIRSYMVHSPQTLLGIERYLASGILPGVGAKTASRIVKHFGDNTLNILDSNPNRLNEVATLKPSKIDKIKAAWQSRRALSDVMVFLQSYGISPNFADKIYRIYRDQTVPILRTNPYRLAWDVRGIGFKKADQIALQMGMQAESAIRCEAAVLYQLRTFADQGHVFYPLDRLIQETSAMLELTEDPIGEGVNLAKTNRRIVIEEITWNDDEAEQSWRGLVVYLSHMYQAEVGTSQQIMRLLASKGDAISHHVEATLKNLQEDHGLELGVEQVSALQRSLQSGVSVITGGPGTGKTTMIRALVHLLRDQKQRLVLAAPTGRAAKRLAEATGCEAKTLHRLLEYRPHERKFARNADNPLECDWVIVDETSMVDIFLIQHLLLALADGTHLVMVGDKDQLPSVGSGNVLRDMIDSQVVPVAKLSQIYRQAMGSLITINAHSINRGEFPRLVDIQQVLATAKPLDELDPGMGGVDCYFLKEEDPAIMQKKICWLATEVLPKRFDIDVLQELQVITPMHKGDVGSIFLNQALQQALNPKQSGVDEVRRGEKAMRVGDRVMQVRNNYDKEVFNGDIGQIIAIDLEDDEVKIRFDYVDAIYSAAELDEIELAYAVTVHKSQGSEYPVVLLPITTQHYIMLQRNLLYTALTRAKALVILIGSPKAIGIAIQNDRMSRRYSFLAQRLRHPTPNAVAATAAPLTYDNESAE